MGRDFYKRFFRYLLESVLLHGWKAIILALYRTAHIAA